MVWLKWVLRRKILALACLVVIVSASAQNSKYIASHKDLTTSLSEQFGIPNSVIMAIAIVESSSGVGPAAKLLHNHFGMAGKKKVVTNGVKSRYKKYETEEDSYLDFCQFVARKKFYNKLKDSDDPKKWVKALSKSGYSTQPKVWEKRILNTISTNRL